MALTEIGKLFPEVVHTPPKTLVDRPGWLYAQSSESWWKGQEHLEPTTILLVYRSPLVKDTKMMYRPVLEEILGAGLVDVIGQGRRVDPYMIHGDKGAQFMVARMTHADAFPPGPMDMAEVRDIIVAAVGDVLTRVMAVSA